MRRMSDNLHPQSIVYSAHDSLSQLIDQVCKSVEKCIFEELLRTATVTDSGTGCTVSTSGGIGREFMSV